VKLLFDENLSPVLPRILSDCYSECEHVREVGLAASPDTDVWEYAVRNQFAIVTKDSDFRHRSSLRGHPPKVIWIALGNCSTRMVEGLLRHRITEVTEFGRRSESISGVVLSSAVVNGAPACDVLVSANKNRGIEDDLH